MILLTLLYFIFFSFLIGIHSMQGWTATMRWGTRSQEREVQKKKKKKKKKAYRKSVFKELTIRRCLCLTEKSWNLSEQWIDFPREWGSGTSSASSDEHVPK